MAKALELTYQGKTQSRKAWCREYDIPEGTLTKRMENGMDLETALLTPHRHEDALTIEAGDPECLAQLATRINYSVLDRFEKNMPDIHDWIDTNSKTDPEKVAKLIERLSNIFDRMQKHTIKANTTERTAFNISINTESRGLTLESNRGEVD